MLKQQCMLKLMAHHLLDNASVSRSPVVLLHPVMALDLEVLLCDGTSEKVHTHPHTHLARRYFAGTYCRQEHGQRRSGWPAVNASNDLPWPASVHLVVQHQQALWCMILLLNVVHGLCQLTYPARANFYCVPCQLNSGQFPIIRKVDMHLTSIMVLLVMCSRLASCCCSSVLVGVDHAWCLTFDGAFDCCWLTLLLACCPGCTSLIE